MRSLFLLLVLTVGCTSEKPVVCLPRACYRSFYSTLRVWEARLGRVPEACQYLDSEYVVQIVPKSEIPCVSHKGFIVTGCTTVNPDKGIYLLEGRAQSQFVDTSVHEWIHALSDCVNGGQDETHMRAELWADYSTDSIEIQAQASAEVGSCL